MLHQIGVGALGPVFRTYEPTRDRLVAVKVFRLDVTPEQAAALAEELGRATEAGLFHASIVEPLAAGLQGTVAYRAEEYVAAESLDVAMRHYAPASLDKALPFMTQLASAIDAARAAGVGHGALHPRDIFVTPDEARATGFGVVDALERLGLRAPVRRPYSAPERVAGQAWSTPADVFSLGAIAFELLTGRRPAGAGEQMGSLNAAALGSHADAIRRVLAKAMDEDPSVRYQTAAAFASALSEAAALESVASDTAPAVDTPVAIASEPAPASESVEPLESESLDVFVTEPLNASVDSPREAARRAIAARKRQPRPKPEEKPENAEPTLATPEPEAAPEPPIVVAADEPEIEPSTPAAPPIAAEATAELQTADEIPAIDEPSPALPAQPRAAEQDELASGLSVATLADVDLWHLDPVTAKGPEISPADVEPDMPAVAAALRSDSDTRVDPKLRDGSERVVAVDEFRARESSPKSWSRPSERPMPSIAPVSRGVPPPTKLLETNDVPLVPADEPEQEPPRTAMMPIAVGLLLGLLLGYGGGYFVGWRDGAADTATQVAQNTARPPDSAQSTERLSTPGTSGQSREFSDQAVTPASGRRNAPAPAVDTPQRAPSASAAATTPAAPAATKGSDSPPATAASKPAPKPSPKPPTPSKPAAVKTTPTAAPPPAAAASTGTIVVTSSPAKAAVTVNGVWTGRTPLTLERRPFGDYVIRVVQTGYDVARETFKLSAAAPSRTIDITLKPAATPAAGVKPAEQRPAAPDAPNGWCRRDDRRLVRRFPSAGREGDAGRQAGGRHAAAAQRSARRLARGTARARRPPGVDGDDARGQRRDRPRDRIAGTDPMKATLALENGIWYEGEAAGAPGETGGEVVFNTSMTGYQEVLTDPSYAGQIVTMTSPEIGNYGVADEDAESRGPQVAGFIVREESPIASNWRADTTLRDYLVRHNIVAISDIDTRALTRVLRSSGVMRGSHRHRRRRSAPSRRGRARAAADGRLGPRARRHLRRSRSTGSRPTTPRTSSPRCPSGVAGGR